jgi:hypothetical protein
MTIRIGSGSAWWGDRISPAAANANLGKLQYLCFETMAEATISAAQVRKRKDPSFGGYDTWLDDRMNAVLPGCLANNTKIISNQGWINPIGAAERVIYWLKKIGAHGVRVAAINGGLITDDVIKNTDIILESGLPTSTLSDSIVSGEVYLGAAPIVEALKDGADIVITGRVADPSLFAAPLMYEFGWNEGDYHALGVANGIGHLLECGAQITGGYFADPGFKDIDKPWDLAFPIAEVTNDGTAVITKLDHTGGAVNLQTVKEQLLYEVHDPANYITPDVIVDFSATNLRQVDTNRVEVSGITGKKKTSTLKVSIGCVEGHIGEDMFFYAGEGAMRRARLAEEILRERFKIVNLDAEELRIDFLGHNAIHGKMTPDTASDPYEVAVRVAARCKTRSEAEKIGREVDGMAVSGVGMTGKRVPHQDRTREIIGVWSSLIKRELVSPTITFYES